MRAADAELFRDKIELSLDGKQVFYLFFGGAVLACMVFVLGVMVGKRVEARSAVEHPQAGAASDPLAALDQLDARSRADDLTFRRALRGGEPVTGMGAVDAELVARGKASDAKSEAAAPPAKAPPQKQAPPKADKRVDKPAAAKAVKPEAPTKPKAAVLAPKDGPKAETVAKPKPAPKSNKARFTLQLSSFQDEAEAQAFAGQLRGGGYQPYIKKADVKDKGVWYRVRLGRYPSFDKAVAAKEKFEAERGVIAYVTRL